MSAGHRAGLMLTMLPTMLLVGCSSAKEPPAEVPTCTPSLSQTAFVATETRGVIPINDVLYIGDDYSGFRTVDVADAAAPRLLGALPELAGVGRGLSVTPPHAFLASADGGLHIIDVADPAAPAVIRQVSLPGYARHVVTNDTRAWVAADFAGLRVVDISDPAAADEVGSLEYPAPFFRIQVAEPTSDGQRIGYLAAGPAGLLVVDLSNDTPVVIAEYDTPGFLWDVALQGTTLWLADHDRGIRALDVSNPVAPSLLGTLETPGHARSLWLMGDRALLADGSNDLDDNAPDPGGFVDRVSGDEGLQILDISDASNPKRLGDANTDGYALVTAAEGTRAYVGAVSAGIRIYELAGDNATPIGAFGLMTGSARALATDSERVVVAAGRAGLRVARVTGDQVSELAALDVGSDAQDVVLRGDQALVGTDEAVVRVDVSDPERPVSIGSVPVAGGVRALAVMADGRVLVAAGGGGLGVLGDTSITLEIAEVAVARMVADGDRVILGLADGHLQLTDGALNLQGRVALPTAATGLRVDGNTVWAALGDAGFVSVDITDPNSPAVTGHVQTRGPVNEVLPHAGWLLVAVADTETVRHQPSVTEGTAGIEVYSMDGESAAYLELIESAHALAVVGDTILVAAATGGLRAVRWECL